MPKGEDARVKVILECIGCVREIVNNESRGISKYITQKNLGGIAKILSQLLQTYNSWRDKEIDRTERLSIILSRKGTKPFSFDFI